MRGVPDGISIRLDRRRRPRGYGRDGIVQRWIASRDDRAETGVGSSIKDAIADLRPDVERLAR